MKCAVVIAGDVKQVMFTPENESEKFALKMITAQDQITVDVKMGGFFDELPESALGYSVAECRGQYLRAYSSADSLMLVLRPKPKEPNHE